VANEEGAGNVMEMVEKRLEMDLWQLECKDEDSDQKDIMLWGDVKHKVAPIKSWRPRIHQLFLHVGTRQQSASRVVRSCGCLEPGCTQLRIPMSIDDGPKQAKTCRLERRGGS
jgi:nicotinamide mononucleotide adenylyltransferase